MAYLNGTREGYIALRRALSAAAFEVETEYKDLILEGCVAIDSLLGHWPLPTEEASGTNPIEDGES